MKYKQLKPISLEKLWDAQPHKTCIDFLTEWAVFMNWMTQLERNVGWPTTWKATYETFMFAMKTHSHSATWLGYMEKHGFIAKEFEPFDLMIPIPDVAFAIDFYNALNKSQNYLCTVARESLGRQLKAHGIEV